MHIIEGVNSTTLVPTGNDCEITKAACKKMISPNQTKRISLVVESDSSEQSVDIPAPMYQMLMEIVSQVSEGNSVSLVATQAELTSQEAADFLNVSRPFLIKLLNEGVLLFRKVGKHRRILLTDLIRYKKHVSENREQVLEELARQAQELKMGYEK